MQKSILVFIKFVHTLIWLFFTFIIFYMLYAAAINNIDMKFWLATALVAMEGLILVCNCWQCPLTTLGEKYSKDLSAGFDIFLPRWLAKHNKAILGTVFYAAFMLGLLRTFKV